MTQTIVETTPTNKAHTTEHKSISDFSFYGIVNQIEKELSEGWEINNQEYPIFTGTLYTVAFKRAKTPSGTVVAPSAVKAVKQAENSVKVPSVRRSKAVTTKVVAKPTKTVNKAVITSTNG